MIGLDYWTSGARVAFKSASFEFVLASAVAFMKKKAEVPNVTCASIGI